MIERARISRLHMMEGKRPLVIKGARPYMKEYLAQVSMDKLY